MEMKNDLRVRIGYALCGSFCTLKKMIDQMERLAEAGFDIVPIMSETTYTTDTRFGSAQGFRERVERICGKPVLHTLSEVEPFGPKKMLDLLIVAPCTGNTLAKIANGVSDSSVSLAVKAHLRNAHPVLLAISSNDALAGNAKNLGQLLNTRHIYFVPFGQDDAEKKPTSLVAAFDMIPPSAQAALEGRQLQPILSFPRGHEKN